MVLHLRFSVVRYLGMNLILRNFGRRSSAFTLIELVVVIVVIAVLAAVGMFYYSSVVDNSRTAAAVESASQLKKVSYASALALTGSGDLLAAVSACSDKDGDGVSSSVDVALCEAPPDLTVSVFAASPRKYDVSFKGGHACWALGFANDGGVVSSKNCGSSVPSTVSNVVVSSPSSTVNVWGSNTSGQVGNGLSSTVSSPQDVSASGVLAGKTLASLAVGYQHSCVVADSAAYCWGYNASRQLGLGNTTDTSTPSPVLTSGVLAGKSMVAVSAGQNHSCGLDSDGKAYCWGANSSGQLGDGSSTTRTIPVAVDVSGVLAGKVLSSISAGSSYTCAVDSDGKAYCWGSNGTRQLGDGSNTQRNSPVAVDVSGVLAGKVISKISVGVINGGHTCAVASDAAYCWGSNAFSQVGAPVGHPASAPTAVTASGVLAGKTVTDIVAGTDLSCAVASSGVYCWGRNNFGQLGDGSTTTRSTPVAVSTAGVLAAKSMVKVSSAGYSSCALDSSGVSYCWGSNGEGELGVGSTVNSSVPVTVSAAGVLSGRVLTSIVSGSGFTCASDSEVYCWGGNSKGQLGINTTVVTSPSASVSSFFVGKKVTSLAGGSDTVCAVASGEVYCWGDGGNGELGVGSSASSVSPVLVTGALVGKSVLSVSVSSRHACAVTTENLVYCWGSNSYGQLGDGTTTARTSPVAVSTAGVLAGKVVSSVSVGDSHTCVVASDGAYCWGYNGYYQLGDGSNTQRNSPVAVSSAGVLSGKTVTMVAAGGSASCAVASGVAYCWGSGSNGQLGDNATVTRSTPVAVWAGSGPLLGKVVVGVSRSFVDYANPDVGGGCAWSSDGSAACWGVGNNYVLGNGSLSQSQTPQSVSLSGGLSGKSISSLVSLGNHVCALASDGSVSCWGGNGVGQVGNGFTSAVSVPSLVSGVSDVSVLTAGMTASASASVSGSHSLSWDASEGASVYKVLYRASGSGSWSTFASNVSGVSLDLEEVVSGVCPSGAVCSLDSGVPLVGSVYEFAVVAVSAGGDAPVSSVVSTTWAG